jgi:hypothetical protein
MTQDIYIYTTGHFKDTADFDPGSGYFNIISNGNDDVFICKLTALGNFVWSRRIGGAGYDYGESIAVDDSGNVYTTGRFQDTVDFDPGAGANDLVADYYDIFISKLSASRNFIWAGQISGTGSVSSQSSFVDASGNIYITGYFAALRDFNPGTTTYNLTSFGNEDVFICKLNSAGNFVWAVQMGGIGQDLGISTAVDYSGNVYCTGFFEDIVDFDPGSGAYNLTAANGLASEDIFVYKMSQSSVVGSCQQQNVKAVFLIYPNPADGLIKIEKNVTTDKSILSVFDVNGREWINQVLRGNKTEIDVSQLSDGIYFIKLVNDEKVEFGKFVKE